MKPSVLIKTICALKLRPGKRVKSNGEINFTFVIQSKQAGPSF